MNINRILKRSSDKTYTGYDYTLDGASDPRVKGEDKRKRTKLERTIRKRIDRKEAEQFDEHSCE